MRPLADFIMRGRVQATLVVAGCAALPLLFWLSAAAACLVLLRRGFEGAFGVLAWGVLPAFVWWYFGEPRTLMVLLGSVVLAQLLRAGWPWSRVLLASIGLGLVYGVVLGSLFREPIDDLAQMVQTQLPRLFGGVYQQLKLEEQARLEALIAPVLNGLIASVLQACSVVVLMLGRYWQAVLYNPGGFGREFRAVRIPGAAALLLLVLMLVGPQFGAQVAMLTPLCSVPLMFAGLALIHGLVAMGKLGRFWLVGLYLMLVVSMQAIYPLLVLLAIVDSLIDFRGRLAPPGGNNQGPANGEG
ncbi:MULTISPECIES: hypothetical protein [unclassified Pseudomonas]|uniref:hypothetical protein n=1 Tax=unclassified Pseudomonas TaxID=196821 RepID=UPI000BD6228C|nr:MULTISPECIES: hypothetical protein [unclassified Pseudomonas]PVZ09705.1 hypothetical protein F474_04278 [Pseudomonas sp. URIL14HWK12:I12]PVZ21539.1 hypothetical protein F470_04334 [Pseudomonas sp. URIL14HWK12:I10]PVZ30280.1 hypothetical protein F472_04281 [Pseudomonas sp. URIL14HWK12:I11]SNZ18577.1 hypothetical protein SAMN05660463_04155 [Pseudomonas sp. URIL14HWK12:I9]